MQTVGIAADTADFGSVIRNGRTESIFGTYDFSVGQYNRSESFMPFD